MRRLFRMLIKESVPLFFLLLVIFLVGALDNVACKVVPVALVTGVYHSLQITRGSQLQRAAIGMVLYNDDVISTDRRAQALILLRDGTEVKMSRATKIVLGEEKGREKVMVAFGKIYVGMPARGARAEFESPQGSVRSGAAELQLEVSKSGTRCVVAKGKAHFSTGGGSVELSGGQETLGTSKTVPPSKACQISPGLLIAWQKDLVKFYRIIPVYSASFMQAYNQARSSGGAGGSLMQAQGQIERMSEIKAALAEIVPDDKMRIGHGRLREAFDLYMSSLASIDPRLSADFRTRADGFHAGAQAEVVKWKPQNDAMEKRFVTNPHYTP
jgi:hypothetical protein